jgi:ABC-type Fe3+-hydroxamate transport system substrate-binding protein
MLASMAPARVVSLVPSVTESLCAIGLEPIACTRFCERPDLPAVGGTKDPDLDGIELLSPDLVVVDTEENRIEDVDALHRRGIEVHATSVRSLHDVNPTVGALAARVGLRWSPFPVSSAAPWRASAFVPIWRRPWMAIGAKTYGTSLLEHLGITNVCSGSGSPYPTIELADAAALEPDLVVAPSEPYPFSVRQLDELTSVAPTLFVDGKDLFWWGTRTPGALERLDAVLSHHLG